MVTISAICASSCRCGSETGLLTSLSLRGFRSLDDTRWQPGGGAHVLLGANGAGKTSLIEAVYVLATTRSFRTPRLENLCRRGADGFSLVGKTADRKDLELGWSARGGRHRRLNGSRASGSKYLEALSVVCWSAEQHGIIDHGPGDRRRLLDQGIVGLRPAAVSALSSYRRALEHKRRLLKDRGPGLAAWNKVLAEAAAEIMSLRATFAQSLAAALDTVLTRLNLELPPITVRYEPSLPSAAMSADEIFDQFEDDRALEQATRRVRSGPHRDDLEILWDGVEIAGMASAGEKKLFGLALTSARAEVLIESGRRPLILLDDIDAEVDYGRLESLWAQVCSQVDQAIATTSHDGALEVLEGARVWPLVDGALDAVKGRE